MQKPRRRRTARKRGRRQSRHESQARRDADGGPPRLGGPGQDAGRQGADVAHAPGNERVLRAVFPSRQYDAVALGPLGKPVAGQPEPLRVLPVGVDQGCRTGSGRVPASGAGARRVPSRSHGSCVVADTTVRRLWKNAQGVCTNVQAAFEVSTRMSAHLCGRLFSPRHPMPQAGGSFPPAADTGRVERPVIGGRSRVEQGGRRDWQNRG